MNDKGWIKKHRSVFDWGWFSDDAVYRFFDCCIMDANIEDGEFLGNKIPRGSFATSYNRMSTRYKMSKMKVKRCINCLKKTGEIRVRSTSKFTLITIVNYEYYQSTVLMASTQPSTHLSTQSSTQPSINQRKEEIKNTSVFVSPSLDDVKSYAQEKDVSSDMAIEFYDFYESNGWHVGNNKMQNWKAAFNGWIRRKQKESSYEDDVQMNIQ